MFQKLSMEGQRNGEAVADTGAWLEGQLEQCTEHSAALVKSREKESNQVALGQN